MGGRDVELVVCSGAGRVLGRLSRFPVESPWWPDVEPVVAAARRRFGVAVTVLRLIGYEPARRSGGRVSYLAELVGGDPGGALDGSPWLAEEPPSPLQQPWAVPGGVGAIVEWVDRLLVSRGIPRTGPVEQVKSWNLSLVLRVPTGAGAVWAKAVPPFFAHEGAMIDRLARDDPALVPRVIGFNAGIAVLAHVPGDDQFEADEAVLAQMISRLVGLQVTWSSRTDELDALGVPSWRADVLPERIRDALERPETLAALPAEKVRAIRELVGSVPDRLAELAACGLPDTLVHGDFHPGNWRSDGSRLVLLDWGDSGVGHPMLDMPAFLTRVPPESVEPLRRLWIEEWERVLPGSGPSRAAALIRPLDGTGPARVAVE